MRRKKSKMMTTMMILTMTMAAAEAMTAKVMVTEVAAALRPAASRL